MLIQVSWSGDCSERKDRSHPWIRNTGAGQLRFFRRDLSRQGMAERGLWLTDRL
jgi:hypothetical protein